MATLEREFSARWGVDEVFRYFRDGILAGSSLLPTGEGVSMRQRGRALLSGCLSGSA